MPTRIDQLGKSSLFKGLDDLPSNPSTARKEKKDPLFQSMNSPSVQSSQK